MLIKFFIFIFLSSTFVHANIFQKECSEVGNYLHDNSGEVHNALYVKYNGVGELKKEVYLTEYNQRAWRSNWDVGYGITERFSYLRENFKKNYVYLQQNQEQEKQKFEKRRLETSRVNFKKEEKLFSFFYAKRFCRKLIKKHARTCKKNIKRLFNLVSVQQLRPHGKGPATSMTLPELIQKSLTSATQLELVDTVLAKLMPKIEDDTFQVSGNIMELLQDEVKNITLAEGEAAEEIIWNLLGAYASRGASFDGYRENLVMETTKYSYSAHFELFNLIHAFDSQRSKAQYLFSLPRFKQNSCQFGKSYHFWMGAYLSRYLMKRYKQSQFDAFAAASAVGVMYDFFGSGADQRKRTRIYQEDLDSIYTKSIQQSMLFKILGALYGVAPELAVQTNVDELYQVIKENMSKPERRIFKKTWLHIYNLPTFLKITNVDKIVANLGDKMIAD